MIKRIFFSSALFFSPVTFATNIFVGPQSAGNASGSDWNNTIAWSSTNFARGNVYYLKAGTYTGMNLSTPESGTTSILIKKCWTNEGVCNKAPGWADSMGSAEAVFTGGLNISTGYWEINGGTGGGPGSWKSGHGFKWTSPAGTSVEYISISNVSNIIVSHTKFEQVGNTQITTSRADAIYDAGTLLNSRFEYNYFENLGGLPFVLREGSGNIFQYNYSGQICGMSVADYNQHCEGIVIHSMSDIHFRWNYIAHSPSSGGFVKNNTTTSDSVRIYGNYFADGFPINCNSGPCTNWRIFNNTFANSSGPVGGDGGFTNLLLFNNITFNASTSALPGTHDYNWFSKITSNSCKMAPGPHENVIANYPNDCDAITETLDPFVNSAGTTPEDWKLNSATLPGLIGTNVCALDSCTGEKKYNLDSFGTLRGASGSWLMGAYEFGSASSLPPSLNAPTNLRLAGI
ncbi:MAG: hypothetical protein ACXVB1_11195 [Pseudobdellovibrionaceae bacterium]